MSDFLYPFLSGESPDVEAVLDDLVASAIAKAEASAALVATTLDELEPSLRSIADEMAERFGRGGRLFTFGNGGSSTDAAGIASSFARPVAGLSFPARSLVDDGAVLTALGNDIGFDGIFSRQVIAFVEARDIAIGVSTSGDSTNVLAALTEARARGALAIGLAGYDGGAMADGAADHLLVVHSDSVHRIQEAQAAVAHRLRTLVTDRCLVA